MPLSEFHRDQMMSYAPVSLTDTFVTQNMRQMTLRLTDLTAGKHSPCKHEDTSAALQGPHKKLGDAVLCLTWRLGRGDQRRRQADSQNKTGQLAWSTR